MAAQNTSVIQTTGLTKVFRDFWYRRRVVAVDKLELDVHANEVFGLLGPNGSGKSTTIKMLLGLLYPTRGRIRVLGRPPTDVAIKGRIGYLPEESYLYRFLNARETLDYYGQLFQIPRQERRRRVEQLLEMVGLTREARRRVGEYSKGMARRIGLAQALINDPQLLILDEPTTGLDPIGTREIKDLITFLNREKGKTILLCSHLLGDVEDVCQRVTVLYGGRLQAMGDIRELLSQENLTQITTDRLNEATLEKVRRLVEEEAGKQVVRVSTPSDKLETFFLRIVREAQQAQQQTSGVTSGGQIANFLATPPTDGDGVVASLVAAAETKPELEAARADEVDRDHDRRERDATATEVVDGLMTATSPTDASAAGESEAAPPGAPGASGPAPDPADRALIDDLIRRAEPGADKAEE